MKSYKVTSSIIKSKETLNPADFINVYQLESICFNVAPIDCRKIQGV